MPTFVQKRIHLHWLSIISRHIYIVFWVLLSSLTTYILEHQFRKLLGIAAIYVHHHRWRQRCWLELHTCSFGRVRFLSQLSVFISSSLIHFADLLPVYSLDDTSGDTSFSHFNINNIPSYVFSVLKDIQSTNSLIKIHILPWSPVSLGTSSRLIKCDRSDYFRCTAVARLDEGQRFNEWWIITVAVR